MQADMMKPIRLSGHALGYVARRGFSVAEVEETIHTSAWEPAELGRLQCQKDFPFGKQWNNVYYGTKRVRPIFVEEPHEIVVVTVYTFYF